MKSTKNSLQRVSGCRQSTFRSPSLVDSEALTVDFADPNKLPHEGKVTVSYNSVNPMEEEYESQMIFPYIGSFHHLLKNPVSIDGSAIPYEVYFGDLTGDSHDRYHKETEESKGRGKTYTPDEYKKMRDETKEELRTDPNLMNEVRGDNINENKAELVNEAQKQAEKEISEIKDTLADETRQIKGKIALEKRITQ